MSDCIKKRKRILLLWLINEYVIYVGVGGGGGGGWGGGVYLNINIVSGP